MTSTIISTEKFLKEESKNSIKEKEMSLDCNLSEEKKDENKSEENIAEISESDSDVNMFEEKNETEGQERGVEKQANSFETVPHNEAKDSNSDKVNDEDKDKEEEDGWVDLLGSGSIKKKILIEGTPQTKPKRLQRCVVNYTIWLEDGTEVESKENFEMNLSDSDIIQGIDVAIVLMNVGEKCRLKIKSRLGYGAQGLLPHIPPNSDLVCDVELVSVQDYVEPEDMSFKERKLKGNEKRNRGNWYYGRGDHQIAIQCYRRALEYLDKAENNYTEEEEVSDVDLQALLEDRVSVYNNMAAAQIKLQSYDEALTSLGTVLRCQPNNVKALFRKAKVYKEKLDIENALKWIMKANEVAPNNKDILEEKSKITAIVKKQKSSERELARRMIRGGAPENNKKVRSKLALWSSIGAGLVALVFGMAAYKLRFN